MSLIIFDMDGVIVDVSGSYREAARQTAGVFMSFLRNAEVLPTPLFTLEDVAFVKQSGGLNNDWDLTYKLIDLLGNIWNTEYTPLTVPGLRHLNAQPLAEYLEGHERPLQKLYTDNPGLSGLFANFYAGDVGSGNVIKQIFQEIYLGQNLFEATYQIPAEYVFSRGLIADEPLFLQTPFFAELAKKHTLAIATGRPLNEALYPLEKHGLKDYFAMLLSHDECQLAADKHLLATGEKCSFGKPNPFMLDTISREAAPNAQNRYFVGDMPDDMQAAKRAQGDFTAVGVTYASKGSPVLEELLLKNKADVICKTPAELELFLLEKAA